ncbi:MAG: polysaccharide biosynthesis protein [Verrucomicrobiae bacterium]|nr:polysaccharide biosynthesis protein [Verrucomicrobiae bacterium]
MDIKIFNRMITPKKLFLVLYDALMSPLSYIFSLLIVANFKFSMFDNSTVLWRSLVYFLSALAIFHFMRLYQQIWTHASVLQYFLVPVAVFAQTVFIYLLRVLAMQDKVSWAEIWTYFTAQIFAVIAIRVIYRLYRNYQTGLSNKMRLNVSRLVRVLIIGAGRAGSRLAEDLLEINGTRVPVGFIDDNPRTHNYKHFGIPVVGGRYNIPEATEALDIDEIIIAIPSMPADEIRKIVEICQQTHCRIRILPSVTTLTEDKVGLHMVKDVAIEDLLGRTPIRIQSDSLKEIIQDKVVLVTGGGGSIGSEICRQVAKLSPKQLIIVDIYENNVYELQQMLRSKYGTALNLQVLIASVRDKKRIHDIFAQYKPQVVYHAAAHKHVPLMEDSPEEAIKNNVYGTNNVANAAGLFKAERFVLVSTDKAVNPTSVMGASKRLAEMTVLATSKVYKGTKFGMVRFGNVLGSNGSVVPLFKHQIEFERRVTVTHPDMRRYFMTIPEAVSLVLQASAYADRGNIFVLEMGDPVKIVDLATAMIRLSGYEPNVDIPIEFVGLRPGEKLFEELYFDLETLDKTQHEKIMRLRQIEDKDVLSKEIDHLFDMFGHEYPEVKENILSKLG